VPAACGADKEEPVKPRGELGESRGVVPHSGNGSLNSTPRTAGNTKGGVVEGADALPESERVRRTSRPAASWRWGPTRSTSASTRRACAAHTGLPASPSASLCCGSGSRPSGPDLDGALQVGEIHRPAPAHEGAHPVAPRRQCALGNHSMGQTLPPSRAEFHQNPTYRTSRRASFLLCALRALLPEGSRFLVVRESSRKNAPVHVFARSPTARPFGQGCLSSSFCGCGPGADRAGSPGPDPALRCSGCGV
jgi:hypothetical protein